jgi:hypothetical protein
MSASEWTTLSCCLPDSVRQIFVDTRGGFAAVPHGAHDTVRHAESVEQPTTCPRYARAQLFFHLAKFQISREHQKPDEADAHS